MINMIIYLDSREFSMSETLVKTCIMYIIYDIQSKFIKPLSAFMILKTTARSVKLSKPVNLLNNMSYFVYGIYSK